MARKPGASFTITVAPSSDLVFGGHIDYTVNPALVPPLHQTHVVVSQNGIVVMAGYGTTYPDGDHTYALGPTPRWSGGGASGSIEVVAYDAGSGLFVPVKGSAVPFTVAP